MMRRSPTFFDLAALFLIATQIGNASAVRGIVEVTAMAKGSIRTRAQNLADVIVWLKPLRPIPTSNAGSEHARLLQKNKTFTPHVLPVRLGTVVDFPNADPIFHNAFSNYDGQLFDLALYPPGTTRSVQFRRSGVVRVFCNIHASMSAVILVLESPYFARLSPDGSFLLNNVARGRYEVHVFDERATTLSSAPLQITVGGVDQVIPTIKLSEAGYAQLPHKNKYGADYGPEGDSYDHGLK